VSTACATVPGGLGGGAKLVYTCPRQNLDRSCGLAASEKPLEKPLESQHSAGLTPPPPNPTIHHMVPRLSKTRVGPRPAPPSPPQALRDGGEGAHWRRPGRRRWRGLARCGGLLSNRCHQLWLGSTYVTPVLVKNRTLRMDTPIVAEIYLRGVCSCHDVSRVDTHGQARRPPPPRCWPG
jgi:hypothetical protein